MAWLLARWGRARGKRRFRLLAGLEFDQRITDSNFSLGQDLGAQAALVEQAAKNLRRCLLCQVIARLTQPNSTNVNGADPKIPAHEQIQVDANRNQVSPCVPRRETYP